ncbi:MAG: DUF885 domain-containing protein [Acidobacteria bacterium]|nr:DUF885 domain-containing protein [Acidobacteriota bacterium]MBV9476074.1 DUF885 domain-containing protein [Acidobacteriota bacterium]
MNTRRTLATLLFSLAVATAALAQTAQPEWVKRSDANAQILFDILARYSPEDASALGVEGHDTDIRQLPLDLNAKSNAAQQQALQQLQAKLATEKDPSVAQDLKILINATNENIEGDRLSEKYELPYFNITQTFFNGTRALLDDRVAPERRAGALVRLRRYAGLEKGFTPLTQQAMAYTRAHLNDAGVKGPFKDNLEKDLANSDRYMAGIEQLFQKYKIAGYQAPFAELKKQVAAYNDFVRAEILPRATTDFRQPEEMYRYLLRTRGNDMPVEELISRAKTSFREIQNEMQALAPLVAKEKGINATDYRDVIRELKKQQFVGDEILPRYQARLKDIENIVRTQKLVTLPQREMVIRLATAAETAATPAPHVDPPRLLGNTGEKAAFVLPLRIPAENGKEEVGFDDFTFDAASWTLTAHEGRPGHELQFASILEHGVSQARVLFAFNSVNVEGWALYAEAEMKPYEPLDGQLIALQHRLLRAARAYLDPSLQLGRMTRDEAFRVLEDQVALSHAMALQEVERYTFWAPGQAPSYFVGYSRLIELRTDVERMLGKDFDRQSYHDFVLAQGLVPPALLREAVMTQYVKPRLKS